MSEIILGISFFNGTAAEAVDRAADGGLIVAPSGTCFERFLEDADYRRALLTADLVLPDSGLMVSLWRLLRGRKLNRISGLTYLQALLAEPAMRESTRVLWILPKERAREKLLAWSTPHRHSVTKDDCYLAPIYPAVVQDERLLGIVRDRRPANIIIGLGAGAQEKLGWYLRENAGYRPAIHCIGGALGFITGDQIHIPFWADRLYLGWFLRLLSQPRTFIPRLWKARVLLELIRSFGRELPPLRRNGFCRPETRQK